MWMWVLIVLDIITKVHGFSNGNFPQSCDSLSPQHANIPARTSSPPFDIDYEWNSNPRDPITVVLRKTQSTDFTGFMLEARRAAGAGIGPQVGRFILTEPDRTRLLMCNGLAGSAVSQTNNQMKSLIRVNWTAPEITQDIVFRATFLQDFVTFWENVRLPLSLPTATLAPSTTTTTPATTTTTTTPAPSSTTTTPAPSTTTTTLAPSTTTTTPAPSSTTNTPAPKTTTTTPATSTATNTPVPSATTNIPTPSPSGNLSDVSTTTNTRAPSSTTTTPIPSTTTNTPAPSTTTTTPIPSTTTNTPAPSTTTNIRAPSTTTTTPLPSPPRTLSHRVAAALMCVDCVLEEVKMEMSNIFAVLQARRPLYRRHSATSKIVTSTLCLGVEIASLILFCAGDSCNVIAVGLACVVIVINFLEQVMWFLTLRDQLKQVGDIAVKVCFVVHQSFTIAIIYVGVSIACEKNWWESWPLKVLIALTVWIFLAVIWVLVSSTQKRAIKKRNEKVALKRDKRHRQQSQKKNLTATEVIVIAVLVLFVLGTMSLAIAVIIGIVGC